MNWKFYILPFIFFTNCSPKKPETKQIGFETIFKENKINLNCDTINSLVNLSFNKNSNHSFQLYTFNEFGALNEKIGNNFFSEKEIYRFDVNNSLKEYLKKVNFKKNKQSVQEFINYKNGDIINSNSHYFNYIIIDSNSSMYKVNLKYKGGFKIKYIKVLENKFEFSLDELENNKTLFISTKNEIDFWVEKKALFEEEFKYFQINLIIKFYNNKELLKPISHYNDSLITQNLILRKFR